VILALALCCTAMYCTVTYCTLQYFTSSSGHYYSIARSSPLPPSVQLRALLETQSWQQFLETSGGKGGEQLPFFDRILRELEKEDIGPGPAIMEITLEEPAPPHLILSVKPPEVKDG